MITSETGCPKRKGLDPHLPSWAPMRSFFFEFSSFVSLRKRIPSLNPFLHSLLFSPIPLCVVLICLGDRFIKPGETNQVPLMRGKGRGWHNLRFCSQSRKIRFRTFTILLRRERWKSILYVFLVPRLPQIVSEALKATFLLQSMIYFHLVHIFSANKIRLHLCSAERE